METRICMNNYCEWVSLVPQIITLNDLTSDEQHAYYKSNRPKLNWSVDFLILVNSLRLNIFKVLNWGVSIKLIIARVNHVDVWNNYIEYVHIYNVLFNVIA